jgi:predicted RNase H-like HicB family nuclease
MLSEFINKQLAKARYKILKDGNYFGEITGIAGVWANASNLEDCRQALAEVLEDWLFLKIRDGEKIYSDPHRATNRRNFKGWCLDRS